ncbi:AsnC family transcriptional regulator [Streptomyces sp. NPDC056930]|uniref:AsnC family transcriptional regulator n=1 Tax=Streptomyces sp. NPDC056930 TaxID=3345967 RepID=UPI003641FE82
MYAAARFACSRRADRVLLAELAYDGRASYARLAAVSGLNEVTVRRRIISLRASGALYFDLDVDHRFFGYTGTALLRISVVPS